MKTSELTGAALDWAVAIAAGHRPTHSCGHVFVGGEYGEDEFDPSTDPAQAYPIIYREGISVVFDRDRVFDPNESVERWYATLPMICDAEYTEYGQTPLIAAMRAYVASKLGDEVDVPDELISQE